MVVGTIYAYARPIKIAHCCLSNLVELSILFIAVKCCLYLQLFLKDNVQSFQNFVWFQIVGLINWDWPLSINWHLINVKFSYCLFQTIYNSINTWTILNWWFFNLLKNISGIQWHGNSDGFRTRDLSHERTSLFLITTPYTNSPLTI